MHVLTKSEREKETQIRSNESELTDIFAIHLKIFHVFMMLIIINLFAIMFRWSRLDATT